MTSSFSSTCARGLVAAAVAVVGLVGLAGGGCFKPHYADGGLLCNTRLDPSCPDNYHCVGLVCLRDGEDGGVDQAIEAKVDVPVEHPPDATEVLDATPDVACYTPVTGCTPDTSKMCDPFCQSGCMCHQKCSVNTAGTLTCNVPTQTLPRTEGQSCEVVSEGMALQTDQCEPGLVCVRESCGSICVRFCRADKDCMSSTCSRTLPGGLKGCDTPTTTCNPVRALGDANCGAPAQACYLSTSQTDQTFCDCPGGVGNGDPCNDSRDCLPSLTCADPTGTGSSACHVTCALTGAVSGCPVGQTCQVFLNNTKLGYCN